MKHCAWIKRCPGFLKKIHSENHRATSGQIALRSAQLRTRLNAKRMLIDGTVPTNAAPRRIPFEPCHRRPLAENGAVHIRWISISIWWRKIRRTRDLLMVSRAPLFPARSVRCFRARANRGFTVSLRHHGQRRDDAANQVRLLPRLFRSRTFRDKHRVFNHAFPKARTEHGMFTATASRVSCYARPSFLINSGGGPSNFASGTLPT